MGDRPAKRQKTESTDCRKVLIGELYDLTQLLPQLLEICNDYAAQEQFQIAERSKASTGVRNELWPKYCRSPLPAYECPIWNVLFCLRTNSRMKYAIDRNAYAEIWCTADEARVTFEMLPIDNNARAMASSNFGEIAKDLIQLGFVKKRVVRLF